MLSTISNYSSAVKKKYYDDLADYDKGRIHGIMSAHAYLFAWSMACELYGAYKGRRRSKYPLVHKSIRMSRDSEVLLPLWRRPFPRKWVKVDQKGLVDVAPFLEAKRERVVEVPATLKDVGAPAAWWIDMKVVVEVWRSRFGGGNV